MEQFYIWDSDYNIIQKLCELPKDTPTVVYCAEEYELEQKFHPEFLSNCDNIFYVFGSAGTDTIFYKKYIENSKKLYFWYNFWLYQAATIINLKNLSIPTNKKLFISLNHLGHDHRCCLIDTLEKYNLLKNNIFTWHNIGVPAEYNWKYWTPSLVHLNDEFSKIKHQHILPAEYDDALFNLVAESTVDTIFITEKTWHPILAEKPFLVLAAPGLHHFLKSKGYKLFDNIIDYSFDLEPDLEKRTDMLVQQLKKLENQNYSSLYSDMKYICKHNKNLAITHIKNQEGVPNIAKQFKYYQEIIQEAQCKLDILV